MIVWQITETVNKQILIDLVLEQIKTFSNENT